MALQEIDVDLLERIVVKLRDSVGSQAIELAIARIEIERKDAEIKDLRAIIERITADRQADDRTM